VDPILAVDPIPIRDLVLEATAVDLVLIHEVEADLTQEVLRALDHTLGVGADLIAVVAREAGLVAAVEVDREADHDPEASVVAAQVPAPIAAAAAAVAVLVAVEATRTVVAEAELEVIICSSDRWTKNTTLREVMVEVSTISVRAVILYLTKAIQCVAEFALPAFAQS